MSLQPERCEGSREVRSFWRPAVTMKLKRMLGAGSQPGRSLTRGNTELLERFTPNTVSLWATLTREKGPSPSSAHHRDDRHEGESNKYRNRYRNKYKH